MFMHNKISITSVFPMPVKCKNHAYIGMVFTCY